jgi:hypothetical protein
MESAFLRHVQFALKIKCSALKSRRVASAMVSDASVDSKAHLKKNFRSVEKSIFGARFRLKRGTRDEMIRSSETSSPRWLVVPRDDAPHHRDRIFR